MKINNYDINNEAIGIFLYLNIYKRNYTVFDERENKNIRIHNDIRNRTYSPISCGNINKVDFIHIFHTELKKISIKEVLNLTNKNILILNKDTKEYCINPLFKEEIFNTNWDNTLSILKKINKVDLKQKINKFYSYFGRKLELNILKNNKEK